MDFHLRWRRRGLQAFDANAAALARELVQAAVGIHIGRRDAFRRVARGIGLIGHMRATSPGPAFVALITPILEAAGPLPHARLKADQNHARTNQDDESTPASTAPRKPVNRHIECACGTCGYVVRTARKWLDDIGPPLCPRHGAMTPETISPAPCIAADCSDLGRSSQIGEHLVVSQSSLHSGVAHDLVRQSERSAGAP